MITTERAIKEIAENIANSIFSTLEESETNSIEIELIDEVEDILFENCEEEFTKTDMFRECRNNIINYIDNKMKEKDCEIYFLNNMYSDEFGQTKTVYSQRMYLK